ncbi:chitotriosidase-1-like [Tachypleus tridentatus]|uniref:chitotriosidase-1-like n=1 Tax=Tachypleus tridentatus TaxID=6853 RepID=UPI003FD3E58B
MTYDFHSDWQRQVGHNSPLYPLEGASIYHSKLTMIQWLKKSGYGGVMVWSMDDFRDFCVGRPYPILGTVAQELKDYRISNLPDITVNFHNQPDVKEVVCKDADGVISYHQDCSMYYLCHGQRRHHMPCPPNLVFNPDEHLCDWPENVRLLFTDVIREFYCCLDLYSMLFRARFQGNPPTAAKPVN